MEATGVNEDGEAVEEDLHGCYLLYCTNPKYRGHTYIGYTVNPGRRIRQHNCGVRAGGAKRTSNRGPWEMALIIYGFPNSVSALKFEWAWQNPKKSRRLRHVNGKSSKETAFEYRFRVMCQMLRTGPWKRLPLVIRWLKQEYAIEFNPLHRPPTHMPIVYGPVLSKKVTLPSKDAASGTSKSLLERCAVCRHSIKDAKCRITCLHPDCWMQSHLACLARLFTDKDHLIPIEGLCPLCQLPVLWGDLIRHRNGCYSNLASGGTVNDSELDDEHQHWSAALRLH